ncbi:hypothetical protein MSAN_00049900 [Mycena sanguinolenta]|uniref:Uncharacterized protein n=1 Tax=Mycena sanguinolenta TaxID=230812 RepID=A0A8H7DI70_9AGAR|nr:hypothetical protein MSAN_00049900 [Mycena sanguinolenta]
MFSSPVASSAQSLACVCVTGTNMGDFQEASNLIQSHIGQLIETNTSKVPKDLVARILGPAQDVIKILDSIKHIHPVLATVTGVFTTLIQLEIERRENDKRIVMLQLRMTDLLLVLSSLKDTFTAAGELKMMLDRFLQAVHRTLADVHKSCDTYYERGDHLPHVPLEELQEAVRGVHGLVRTA